MDEAFLNDAIPCPDIHRQSNYCSCHSTMYSHLLVSHRDKTHGKVQHKLCSNTAKKQHETKVTTLHQVLGRD